MKPEDYLGFFGFSTVVTSAVVGAASGWLRDSGTSTTRLATSADKVAIGNNTGRGGRKLSVFTTATDQGLSLVSLAANETAIELIVSGEVNPRFRLGSDGTLEWGPGGATAPNVKAGWGATDRLEFGSGDSIGLLG